MILNEEQQTERFYEGYDAGWLRAVEEKSGAVGDPVGVDEYYQLGWWNGVGNCHAWQEGWSAAKRGILFCPYLVGADDECFRENWMHGYKQYMACMARETPLEAGGLLV